MQTVPSNNDSIELNSNQSNENILNFEAVKQKDQVNNNETLGTTDRIAKIPTNISNIRRENVEFEQNAIQKPQHTRIFKIIVIGDSNVGKTCLTYRFCGGRFLQRSEATIGVDFREKTIQIDNEAIKLQIWDTAGQERFRKSMIAHYYRNVHAVLFVYDVTNPASFENLSFWIEEYNRNCAEGPNQHLVPRVLVGNKCDLDDSVVNTNMAQTFADMHQMPLFETSAKDDSSQDNVEAIFITLAYKLKNSKPFCIPNHLKKSNVESINASETEQESYSACSCFY